MLDPLVKSFAQATNFAAVSTLFPNGDPQNSVMWIDADDEHILLNTRKGRAKYRNLLADPRLALAIIERGDAYRFVEVRGKVIEFREGEEATAHINSLSWKYDGKDFTGPRDNRVILTVEAVRVIPHL